MELKAKAIAVSSLNLLLCLLAFGSEDDVIRIDLSSDVGEVLKVKTGTTSTFVMTLRVAPESDIDLTALLLENNQQPPVWLECPGYLNDSCDSLSIEKGTKKLEFRIIAFPTDIDNEKITLFEPVKLTVRSLVPKSKLQGGDLRVLVIDKRRESLQYLALFPMVTRLFNTMLGDRGFIVGGKDDESAIGCMPPYSV